MFTLLGKLFDRAFRCPLACLLKVMLAVSVLYAGHIALSHQIDVSPYPFILLVASVGLIATLAVAFHWSCRLRDTATKHNLTK
jgi:hypothetical protein